jgi:hypothetical protein
MIEEADEEVHDAEEGEEVEVDEDFMTQDADSGSACVRAVK